MSEVIVLIIVVLLFASIFGFLGGVIYKDAKKRKLDNPLLWAVISSLPFIGVFVYLMQHSNKTEMVRCRHCKSHLTELYAICPYCGANLGVSCGTCGKLLKPDWEVCAHCGTKVDEESKNVFFENYILESENHALDHDSKKIAIFAMLIAMFPILGLIVLVIINSLAV